MCHDSKELIHPEQVLPSSQGFWLWQRLPPPTIDLRSGNNVGVGTGGIRVIQTTDGSGNVTASREIRYNSTTGKWEFTEDGTTFKNLGSGGMGFSYFCGSF